MKYLTDKYGRIHDYLRVSLTDRCNFRCFYCSPNNNCFINRSNILTSDEIHYIIKIFYENFGLRKVRFTGGEPLIRKEFSDILKKIAKLPVKIAITTNGFFLNKYIDLFTTLGIKDINISLDSLKADKFNSIVGKKAFSRVYENIFLYLKQGFHIKLNVVLIRGVNDDEIIDFIELTKDNAIHVRFIEYMPFYGNNWEYDKVVSFSEIIRIINNKYKIIKLEDNYNSTSKAYKVVNYCGTFAIISSVSFPFCSGCNRLRLTADGKLINCLFSDDKYDLLSNLRAGKDIVPIIMECVSSKYYMRGGKKFFNNIINRMQSIGG